MAHNNKILQVALPVILPNQFDYLAPISTQAEPGMRVKVPFGSRTLIGVITTIKEKTAFPVEKLKSITSVLDESPIVSDEILNLCSWASDYYHHPIGDILVRTLPKALRQGKPAELSAKYTKEPMVKQLTPFLALNPEQQNAFDSYKSAPGFGVFLLDGITGSGKTEVYLHMIQDQLYQDKQCLILIPEIGLTPQTLERFEARFNECITVLHSGLNDTERKHAWVLAATGKARIIIGTRSALFAPLPDLGMIIIDEEHDNSFKQQESCRYHARDLACVRAKNKGIPIILGSATPSFESLQNAMNKRYTWLKLRHRAGSAASPAFDVIDLRQQQAKDGLSHKLLTKIEATLENGGQALLFINRRGYAHALICTQCGWTASCPRCDANMTVHQTRHTLICHHCDTQRPLWQNCLACKHTELKKSGTGTEKIEALLQDHFTTYPVVRIDRDSTKRKGSLAQALQQINNGSPQILIGTQMLAKGHHFPNVTLVGIIDADSGFFSSDFRATEKMGQLITQVAGRAGRAEKPGNVYIQTYRPENPDLQRLIQQGYHEFASYLLHHRAQASWPPYASIALIRARSPYQKQTFEFLEEIKQQNRSKGNIEIKMLGPIPAALERRANTYHAHLLIHSPKRQLLQHFMHEFIPILHKMTHKSHLKWSVDIDPVDITQ